MAKFKAKRPKSNTPTPQMKAGLPCVALVVLAMLFTMFLLYEVMKNAS
jgi:hypothetical protein